MINAPDGAIRSAEIELAYIAAHRAGPIHKEIIPLSDSELSSTIDFSDQPLDHNRFCEALEPSILGYEVLGEIGSGGQATTYEAIQLTTGQHVALKVLTGGQFACARHRARFDQEAQLLVTLDHPNIVRIIDRGRTADGSFFIATKFIAGHSLEEYWKECIGPSREDTARLLRLFVTILGALAEAHRQNVIHRDIKPSNIRVDRRGEPHILDFGLARSLSDSSNQSDTSDTKTMSGEIVGSLPWASPEQVTGQVVDARSDVYAVGVMLYQAVSGQFPYATNCTMRDLINQIVQRKPSPPCRHENARKVAHPQFLDAVVMKSLAKRPLDRYGNAEEMACDITRHVENRPTIAHPARRWPRRNLMITAAGMAITIGLATAYQVLSTPELPPLNVVELPTYSNSLGMHFLGIPAGTFTMGSASAEEGRKQDEVQHAVTLSRPFWLSATEVTRRQYSTVMGDPGLKDSDADLPMSKVSWNDAIEFCKRLGVKEGIAYRLPTEAEWEYACRAGTKGPFGGTGKIYQLGWFKENSKGRLHPIASLAPNNFGLFDMHGGVAEWCSDDYEAFSDRPLVDPQGPARSVAHIVRGGSFERAAEDCRSASREAFAPFYVAEDVGFRVVIERARANP